MVSRVEAARIIRSIRDRRDEILAMLSREMVSVWRDTINDPDAPADWEGNSDEWEEEKRRLAASYPDTFTAGVRALLTGTLRDAIEEGVVFDTGAGRRAVLTLPDIPTGKAQFGIGNGTVPVQYKELLKEKGPIFTFTGNPHYTRAVARIVNNLNTMFGGNVRFRTAT